MTALMPAIELSQEIREAVLRLREEQNWFAFNWRSDWNQDTLLRQKFDEATLMLKLWDSEDDFQDADSPFDALFISILDDISGELESARLRLSASPIRFERPKAALLTETWSGPKK